MKILITGASGYVGRHLVKKLSERGIETRAFVRPTSDIAQLKPLKNVEIVCGDLRDQASVYRAVEGTAVVIHAGALVSDWGHYQKFYEVNSLGTKNVLGACMEAGVQRLVYISTIDVLDLRKSRIVNENLPYDPRAKEYSRSKIEAEKLVREHMNRIPAVILRPPAVYGPEDPQCTTRSLNMARNNLLFLVSGGKRTFPHIYIDNLIDSILLAAQREEVSGETFNISDDTNTTAKEFFDHLHKIAGKGPVRLSLAYPLAWLLALLMEGFAWITGKPPLLSWTALRFLSLRCRFDISKAKKVLGYHPAVSLEEGMRRVGLWWDSLG